MEVPLLTGIDLSFRHSWLIRKLFSAGQLKNIAAVRLQHLPKLGYYDVEKSFEIDAGRKIAREAVDYSLAGLVHLDASFRRKGLRGIDLYLHFCLGHVKPSL